MVPGRIRPGTVETDPKSSFFGWFDFEVSTEFKEQNPEDTFIKLLNGQRVCTIEFAKAQGFRGA
jgi:hypothetical protein